MLNDCADGLMRDLLPGYVHGTLSPAERASVAAHLASCEDCSAEVELITAASRAFAAPNVNLDAIIGALPSAPRRSKRGTFADRAQRIAAAIGIVAIGALSVVALRNRFGAAATHATATARVPATGTPLAAAPRPSSPAAATVATAESSVRTHAPAVPKASSLASVPARHPSISFGGGLSDLTDDQLDTLLGELDDLQALPSTEPETHLTPILPPGDGGHGAR